MATRAVIKVIHARFRPFAETHIFYTQFWVECPIVGMQNCAEIIELNSI